jgi:DNA-binding Lrp family transcriptional regulator
MSVPKPKRTESNLRYKVANELYENSRISVRKLALKLKADYYAISKIIIELEQKNRLFYTLALNVEKLGFQEKIIAIKFDKMPDISVLKSEFKDDIFIQNAFLAKGDFDVMLHVVGLAARPYVAWQWTLRGLLGDYKPRFYTSDINDYVLGFFPLSNEIIDASNAISKKEKAVLKVLNRNSRSRLKDIASQAGLSQMQVITTMRNLNERNIIRKYTMLVQSPEKNMITATFRQITPTIKHQTHLATIIKGLMDEDFNQITSDYAILANLIGSQDTFYLCNFKDDDERTRRGPALWSRVCKDEEIEVYEAVLTSIITGVWPIHPDSYDYYSKMTKSPKNADEGAYRRTRELLKKGKTSTLFEYKD